jgi:hypothetical protein
MTDETTPQSAPESVVLRATHILLLRVGAATAGEWAPAAEKGFRRTVEVRFEVLEVLKGATEEEPVDELTAEVEQFESRSPWVVPVPGVWSGQALETGTELLAYCRHPGGLAAEMLREPRCLSVKTAAEGLVSTRLALQAESGEISLLELLTKADAQAESLDQLFVDYLADKIGGGVLFAADVFDPVLSCLETSGLPVRVRAGLLDAVRRQVTTSPSARDRHVNRLILTLFRIVRKGRAPELRDNILEVFLPNLLGLRGGAKKRSATEVFEDQPEERAGAEEVLGQIDTAPAKLLLDWLTDRDEE